MRLYVQELLLRSDNKSATTPVETFVHVDGRCALRADYVTFSAFVAKGALFRAVLGRIVTPSKGSRMEPLSLPATIANARQRTFSTSILKRKRKGEVAVIAVEESAINEFPPSLSQLD